MGERQIMKCFADHPKELELSPQKQWGAWQSNLIKSSEILETDTQRENVNKDSIEPRVKSWSRPVFGEKGEKGHQ